MEDFWPILQHTFLLVISLPPNRPKNENNVIIKLESNLENAFSEASISFVINDEHFLERENLERYLIILNRMQNNQ